MEDNFAIYVVQPGDTVDGIAAQFQVDVSRIIEDNQLVYPYPLAVGQALFIGYGVAEPGRRIRIFGYAYPYISRWVLEQTIFYLSELAVFSYGFTQEGQIVPPALSDDWLIQTAENASAEPVLTLTPFDESGNFSNYLIHQIVNSPEHTAVLIENLVSVMYQKRYRGIDIDFEYILPEDRDAFTQFVRLVTEQMHANGFHTSIALAPKTSADQKGLLYEGKDYRALGEIVDHALLMTYEWGYTYGPPMAVAPIHQVERVVEYAVTEIAPEKLDLGIPNYGYDWPLPYERGVTKALTIGNVEAVSIAVRHGAQISFDALSQSPYFTYEEAGIHHEVWFEDVRSIQKKFELMNQYGLGGCGYWQLMRWWQANWKLLSEYFIR